MSHELQYPGQPDRVAIEHVLKIMETSIDKVARKFGNMNVGPIVIDELLKDGDTIGHTLQVIHTPVIHGAIFVCMIESVESSS
ncbi:hypothetical protein [Candidatus Nitrosocosmicus franklandus]|uniref:hypothetical protein n=1 Tax=Candidatus Nitrosocosmicus franklandianus TaxID=1798806 RepID=UPI00106AB19A|nr:hypothetical protein [Candidatus Nitrosocosmicus franklandus]